MPQTPSAQSWQGTLAALRTPLLACSVVAVVFAALELAARTPTVTAHLPPPSLGSPSRLFELQVDTLTRYAAIHRLDCLILGNSTALLGVNPEMLSHTYRSHVGRDLRCFNFGVAGMTASAAGAIAPIALDRGHPWLLIYMISARDLAATSEGPSLRSIPWVRFRNGEVTVDGWLADHSAAFRYFLLYRQWFDPGRWPAAANRSGTRPTGFLPAKRGWQLTEQLWAHTQRAYHAAAAKPLAADELGGLEQLLDLTASGVQIVLVHAPAHERLRRWATEVNSFYADALTHIRTVARARHIEFWQPPTSAVLADDWTDFVHLNADGAGHFSTWLAGRISEAVATGRLVPAAVAPAAR